jgi:hypothetical protein
MTDEMVERVARAAWFTYRGKPTSRPSPEYEGDDRPEEWDEDLQRWAEDPGLCTHIGADGFRECARAAIEAMREPTPAMTGIPTKGWTDMSPKEVWQDMIDAALQ